MNGAVYMTHSIDNKFTPSVRTFPGSRGNVLGEVKLSPEIELVVYSAAEARRYMAAFAELAELFDVAEQAAKLREAQASCPHPRDEDGECGQSSCEPPKAGICQDCGGPASDGKVFCAQCQAACQAEHAAEAQAAWTRAVEAGQ